MQNTIKVTFSQLFTNFTWTIHKDIDVFGFVIRKWWDALILYVTYITEHICKMSKFIGNDSIIMQNQINHCFSYV